MSLYFSLSLSLPPPRHVPLNSPTYSSGNIFGVNVDINRKTTWTLSDFVGACVRPVAVAVAVAATVAAAVAGLGGGGAGEDVCVEMCVW